MLSKIRMLAYISATFGFTIMHNIFSFYYVKMFLNYYHVCPFWFQVSQILFMIWNTINDPLFGYFQDNSNLLFFKRRRYSILFGAPLYALSFLIAWFPFGSSADQPAWVVGVHLLSALCLYDTFFTFVILAYCCLISEMEFDYKGRLNMKWWSVVTSLCAGVAVPIITHTSDNLACLPCFRITCICIAVVAMFCMIFTGLYATTINENSVSYIPDKEKGESFLLLSKQILSAPNFNGFVWVNFFHQGHSAFLSNFASIFIDFLAPGHSTQFLNVYFILLLNLPQLFIIVFRNMIQHIGYYRIIRASCWIKVISSALVWLYGPRSYVFLAYILLDNVVTHSPAHLYDIVIADIVDEDLRINNRKHSMSAMMFSLSAFITKPAISLFPMIVVALLNYNDYQNAIKDLPLNSRGNIIHKDLISIIMNLVCAFPFVVGIFQALSWSFFTIRNSHSVVEELQ